MPPKLFKEQDYPDCFVIVRNKAEFDSIVTDRKLFQTPKTSKIIVPPYSEPEQTTQPETCRSNYYVHSPQYHLYTPKPFFLKHRLHTSLDKHHNCPFFQRFMQDSQNYELTLTDRIFLKSLTQDQNLKQNGRNGQVLSINKFRQIMGGLKHPVCLMPQCPRNKQLIKQILKQKYKRTPLLIQRIQRYWLEMFMRSHNAEVQQKKNFEKIGRKCLMAHQIPVTKEQPKQHSMQDYNQGMHLLKRWLKDCIQKKVKKQKQFSKCEKDILDFYHEAGLEIPAFMGLQLKSSSVVDLITISINSSKNKIDQPIATQQPAKPQTSSPVCIKQEVNQLQCLKSPKKQKQQVESKIQLMQIDDQQLLMIDDQQLLMKRSTSTAKKNETHPNQNPRKITPSHQYLASLEQKYISISEDQQDLDALLSDD